MFGDMYNNNSNYVLKSETQEIIICQIESDCIYNMSKYYFDIWAKFLSLNSWKQIFDSFCEDSSDQFFL